MSRQKTSAMKLDRFYRFWTLKESVIKAVGSGLPAFHLSELEFRPDLGSPFWAEDFDGTVWAAHPIVDDGTALLNRAINGDGSWHFQLSYLDPKHIVATALDSLASEEDLRGSLPLCRTVDAEWLVEEAGVFG